MEKEKKLRYDSIDSYRGFVILNMVLYHFLYDYFMIYGRNLSWTEKTSSIIWQQFICISFIVVAGISASFSRSLLKRGLLLNGLGFGITLITAIFTPEAVIYFGILNLIGCSLLLLIPVRRWIRGNNWKWWGMTSFFLFIFFRHIQQRYLGIGSWKWIEIPDIFYEWGWLTPFGMPGSEFFSADFFPVFPWFFLFLTGYCFSYLLKRKKAEKWMKVSVPGFLRLGQNSLLIYLVHQPIVLLLSWILTGVSNCLL